MSDYSRSQRRQLERDNQRYGFALVRVPEYEWPTTPPIRCVEVWRSREYLVQIYREANDVTRMSVFRTTFAAEVNRWDDGITWDVLQRLKRECGRGDSEAVEIYPRDADVVNVANMRHLWILPEPMPFSWRRP